MSLLSLPRVIPRSRITAARASVSRRILAVKTSGVVPSGTISGVMREVTALLEMIGCDDPLLFATDCLHWASDGPLRLQDPDDRIRATRHLCRERPVGVRIGLNKGE